MASPLRVGNLVFVTGHSLPMKKKQTEKSVTNPFARGSQYRVVNHKEAGLFDSMTAATVWALKNLSDWDWRIEPVAWRCLGTFEGHAR